MPECKINISQDAHAIARMPEVKAIIRPSLYYKAPKSVFKYSIKFSILVFAYSPQRPPKVQIVSNLKASDASTPVDTGSALSMIVGPNLN